MDYLSLFSGAGGGDLAMQHLLGFKCKGYVEYEEYCQKVLNQRITEGFFDEAPIFGDIRSIKASMIDKAVNYCYNNNNQAMEGNMPAHRKNYSEAVKMYNKGFSIQGIADFYNISRQAMHSILKRRDVKFRPNLKFGEDNHFYRGGEKAHDRSQNLVESAIKKGILRQKSICDECGGTGHFKDGRTSIQAHHDDYNKPIDVRWLCQRCHHKWHKTNEAIEFIGDKREAAGSIDLLTGGFP